MSDTEIAEEREYRYHERLGILCADAEPTPEQIEIATQEADDWVLSCGES